ncbi:unnamed protein product [Eruca vesicaria subsp. sativa]|uniref:F-box domain-containing protein n=1 Tax=Eruca vesicaria subsp. sativa TaxID=29727 RepID=A0ABC8JTI1_ERUVS|nr:unnamed protein product [Eruca vesicaria subsp. sativa]
MDVFDGLPDAIIVDILNKVCDVKTLLRCSSLSKRFNSLVPQSESLILRLEQVITTESKPGSPVRSIFTSLVNSSRAYLSRFSKPITFKNLSPSILSKILSSFDRIKNLEVVLPGNDASLGLEKGAAVEWRAECGKTLETCTFFAFRSASMVSSPAASSDAEFEFETEIKTCVEWIISALIVMSEVVKEHEEMESLVIYDRGGEGTLVMGKEGLREFRKMVAAREGEVDERVEKMNKSVVPSLRMSMRHAPLLKLKSGICLESATLVIIRPSEGYSDVGDDELATEAFAGNCMYGEAFVTLVK